MIGHIFYGLYNGRTQKTRTYQALNVRSYFIPALNKIYAIITQLQTVLEDRHAPLTRHVDWYLSPHNCTQILYAIPFLFTNKIHMKRPFHWGGTASFISCVMLKITLYSQAFGFSSRSVAVRSFSFSSPHPEAVHQIGRHHKDDTAQCIKSCAGASCVRKNNFCFFVLDRSSIIDWSCSASLLSSSFLTNLFRNTILVSVNALNKQLLWLTRKQAAKRIACIHYTSKEEHDAFERSFFCSG